MILMLAMWIGFRTLTEKQGQVIPIAGIVIDKLDEIGTAVFIARVLGCYHHVNRQRFSGLGEGWRGGFQRERSVRQWNSFYLGRGMWTRIQGASSCGDGRLPERVQCPDIGRVVSWSLPDEILDRLA
jgi:hypothetical protein